MVKKGSSKRSDKDSIEEIESILSQEIEATAPKKKEIKHNKPEKKAKEKKEPKEHPATKHPILISLIISLVLTAIPCIFVCNYIDSITSFLKGASSDSSQEQQPDEPEEDKTKTNFGDKPLIFYISGSDSRSDVSDPNARSDVNIVAVVNPTTSKILLVSIPRDYYVQLHDTTGLRDKLTHAGIYGIDMSRQTIEDILDIEVDETIKVGFDALEDIVDAIGGIDIDSDQDLTTHTNKSCHFKEGVQHVDGKCALAFSRERYAYETGDRHRGQNQQQVISKIIAKATTPAYILKLPDILRAADGMFQTSLSYSEMLDIIKYQLFSGTSWKVESISLDGTGSMQPTYSIPSQDLYVMIPDEDSIEEAQEKITQYLKTAKQLEEEEKARLEAEAKAKAEAEAENNNTELTE